MKLRYTSLALLGAVTVAACSDQPVAPAAPTARSAALAPDEAGTYLVRFNVKGVPGTFAA